jgi:hypothetical protein
MPDEAAILLDKLLLIHKVHMQVLVLFMHTEGVGVDTIESVSIGVGGKNEVIKDWGFCNGSWFGRLRVIESSEIVGL